MNLTKQQKHQYYTKNSCGENMNDTSPLVSISGKDRSLYSSTVMEQPSQRWPWRYIIFWLLLAGLACWRYGPTYRRAFQVELYPSGVLFLPDFFQDWASARNRFQGLPIYTSQFITLERYLGFWHNPNARFFIELNAHPPSAVLLGIPFAGLRFADAFALWNVLSLAFLVASCAIIVRQLGLPFPLWYLLPAIALALKCYAFWEQMVHGQVNLLLLLLLTGAWAADRSGRPHWAGTLVAVATAIKLFPGFLFVYFLLRREWKAVRTGLLALAAITVLTALILGPEAYRSYFLEVLPRTSQWRTEWGNVSLSGLWCKLFESPMHLRLIEVQPLVHAPALALLGMSCTLLAVTAILAMAARRLRSVQDWDLLFSLTIMGMLLVSPITWDHYLLLLILPMAVLWQRLPRGGMGRKVVVLLLAILWIEVRIVMEHGLSLLGATHSADAHGNWLATPMETLTALSIPCYALVGLFILALVAAGRNGSAPPAGKVVT